MGTPRDGADASRRDTIIVFLKGQVKAISHQRQDHGGNVQLAGTYRSLPPTPSGRLPVRAVGWRKPKRRHPAGCRNGSRMAEPKTQSDGANQNGAIRPAAGTAVGWRNQKNL